jgi:hypothetical protein
VRAALGSKAPRTQRIAQFSLRNSEINARLSAVGGSRPASAQKTRRAEFFLFFCGNALKNLDPQKRKKANASKFIFVSFYELCLCLRLFRR